MASSVALGNAGFDEPAPVVLRHLLAVPDDQREAVTSRCAAEGYLIDPTASVEADGNGPASLAVAQVMVVDAVVLSRSRARMASIVSRAGGHVVGWAVLRRPDTPVTSVRG